MMLSVVLAGCAPAAFTIVPEIRGRVVDVNGEPVSGASVHITKKADSPGREQDITLSTDSSGKFFRKEASMWGLYIVPMDVFGTQFQIQARDATRRGKVTEFGRTWGHVRILGLGKTDVADLGDLVITPPIYAP
jgi:hypothetical protein